MTQSDQIPLTVLSATAELPLNVTQHVGQSSRAASDRKHNNQSRTVTFLSLTVANTMRVLCDRVFHRICVRGIFLTFRLRFSGHSSFLECYSFNSLPHESMGTRSRAISHAT